MDIIRRLIAEFIGTFGLVFGGVGAIIAAGTITRAGAAAAAAVPGHIPGNTDGHAELIMIALGFGLIIAVMVCAVGHISGAHLNPAVTLGLFAGRKHSLHDTVFYILVQLLAAVAAAGILQLLDHEGYGVAKAATVPGPGVSVAQALVWEIILTFFLVFTVFGTAVDKRGPNVIAGVMIGLVVAVDIMIGGPYTGASMNPARSFGPALIGRVWTVHWVYWAGPIIGGVLAGLIYNLFFLLPLRTVAMRRTTTTTVTAVAVSE
jgi:MIP family channel proteins